MERSNGSQRHAPQSHRNLVRQLAIAAGVFRDKLVSIHAREKEQDPVHLLMDFYQNTFACDQDVASLADQVAQGFTCGLAILRIQAEYCFTISNLLAHLTSFHSFIVPFYEPYLKPLIEERNTGNFPLPAPVVEELGVAQIVNLLQSPVMTEMLSGPAKNEEATSISTHLYENFLQTYSRLQRSQHGIYFTPVPIARFIVRSVDLLLQREFGYPRGLLEKINVLDPAVGSGVFFQEIIRRIFSFFNETKETQHSAERARDITWFQYFEQDLLPRLVGFELQLAPLILAYLCIGEGLRRTGVRLPGKCPLNLRRGNALEVFAPLLKRGYQNKLDVHLRQKKSRSLLQRGAEENGSSFPIVIGNPPYARGSNNVGKHANSFVKSYKEPVQAEKNIQALSDDYLKFLGLGQACVEKAGWGIVGFVLNNRFLSGTIHRGVRAALAAQFDTIYVFDLHGSKKGYEFPPAGVSDENVFNIAQGVCVVFLVKHAPQRGSDPNGKIHALREVFYSDVYGLSSEKLNFLQNHDVASLPWKNLPVPNNLMELKLVPDPIPPLIRQEWEQFTPLSDIFTQYNVGGKPGDDGLLVSFHREEVLPKVAKCIEDIKQAHPRDNIPSRLTEARKKIVARLYDVTLSQDCVEQYYYRPFDLRWVYYDADLWTRGVPALKKQCRGTLILLCSKIATDSTWAHICATRTFPDVICLSNSSSVNCFAFPLRLRGIGHAENNPALNWNISLTFKKYLESMGLELIQAPETEVAGYIYAILSSTPFRERYYTLLRGGTFPRVPLTTDQSLFRTLTQLGARLLAIHGNFAEVEISPEFQTDVIPGDRIAAGYPQFRREAVYINDEKTFTRVSTAMWEYRIGKFNPCQLWLAARVGRELSQEDILHYCRLLTTTRAGISVIREIDEVISQAANLLKT